MVFRGTSFESSLIDWRKSDWTNSDIEKYVRFKQENPEEISMYFPRGYWKTEDKNILLGVDLSHNTDGILVRDIKITPILTKD